VYRKSNLYRVSIDSKRKGFWLTLQVSERGNFISFYHNNIEEKINTLLFCSNEDKTQERLVHRVCLNVNRTITVFYFFTHYQFREVLDVNWKKMVIII